MNSMEFLEKQKEGLWFQFLQETNKVFILVEGKDDMKYYISLLQAYNVDMDKVVIKSPSHFDSDFSGGIHNIVKQVNEAFPKYINIDEKSDNKLLIITDRDVDNSWTLKAIKNPQLHSKIYQTEGYSFENDFVSDELIEYICKKIKNAFIRVEIDNLQSNEEKILDEKRKIENLYELLNNELEYALDLLNEMAKTEENHKFLYKIRKYNYQNKTFDFDTHSEIIYPRDINRMTLHGKSIIEIFISIMRTELGKTKFYYPKRGLSDLIEFTSDYLPKYWENIFEANEIYKFN